jgi:predicted membrane protein
MILVPVGLGFLVMLGLISGGRAAGLLLLFVLLMALAPFVESLMDTLPLWLLLLMLAVFGFSMLRAAASLTLGRGVADNFLGMLVFAVFMAPFRMLRRMIQILFRGGGSA